MKNIIFLNKFYAPKIINVIFWVQAVLYTLAGLYYILDGYYTDERIYGLFLFLFGAIVARLTAELMIVPFRIYEKVCKIYDKMAADEEKFQAAENKTAE